jgi:PHD/YefM family antitoxin component YafN of YafNO toxin-antitoxin module
MKTISIEELHDQTDQIINQAAQDTLVVTRNGRPQAILKPYPDETSLKQHWAEREQLLNRLPKMTVETSEYISQDRDGR